MTDIETVIGIQWSGAITIKPAITVYLVRPPNYAHWPAYQDVAEVVMRGFAMLGYEAIMTSDIGNISGRAIVIGAHVMSFEQAEGLPHKSVIYNTEHVTSSWIKREDTLYLQLLRRYEVWDYNQDNSRYLATILGKDVKFVRVGYVSQSTRIDSAPVLDIDVLFYGSVNARRQVILNGLRSAGLSVHHAFGVYGRQRDALIARSKVVLNMHYYEPGAFEVVRVSYLLANGKAVVTEVNPGETVDEDLSGAMLTAAYGALIEACKGLVEDNVRRQFLEQAGFAAFSKRDESTILKAALGEPTIPVRRSGYVVAESD